MTTLERLARWRDAGTITQVQYDAISAIVKKDVFSVFVELNGLLFLGVLSFVAGVGWVVRDYIESLGDAVIIAGLTAILAAALYYCFSRGLQFSAGAVESPALAFDYILYLACLTFGIEIGYIESRFQLLQTEWNWYLLISAALFSYLAYRFDNRLVLSLALSTLASWFGMRSFQFPKSASLRWSAVTYAGILIVAAMWLYRRDIKKHFTETYFHVAAIAILTALISGVFESRPTRYFLAVLALSAVAVASGIQFRRFAFVVYGIAFGYVAASAELLRHVRMDSTTLYGYFAVSGTIVIIAAVALARRFGREP